jgi:hypothetical protein
MRDSTIESKSLKMYEKLPIEIERMLPTLALQNIYLFLTPVPNCKYEKKIIANDCDMRIQIKIMEEQLANLKKCIGIFKNCS